MYNTKFILQDGREIYPGYMDKEKRVELKEEYAEKRGYMSCGCKAKNKLFYRISEDLKIYPEHNGYVHDQYCSRHRNEDGSTERKTAYVVDEEDGAVTAFLNFNPKNLIENSTDEKEGDMMSPPEDDIEESEDEAIIEKDEGITKKEEKKEPKFSLVELIRSINVDAFTEKVMNDKKVDSRINFSKYVYFRMKKIRVSRMKKSLGELSLESDGVKFFYLPFAGAINKEEKGIKKCYMCTYGPEGKVFNNFIFPDTFEKVIKEFVKNYGIEPDTNTMIAGFQYYKSTRKGVKYRVLGRAHLFQISDIGIYSRTLVEKEAYDSICNIVGENKDMKFWIPADDESIGGIIQIKEKNKKILVLFRGKKTERVTFNDEIYVPLVVSGSEPINKERLEQIIAQMKNGVT